MTDPKNPVSTPELAELMAIRERLNMVLETMSEEDMAAIMDEARDFYELMARHGDTPGADAPEAPTAERP